MPSLSITVTPHTALPVAPSSPPSHDATSRTRYTPSTRMFISCCQ
jgi:hypothetical protein